MRTLRYVVQLALGIVLPLLVQRWDLRHLSPERRARAWNGATWAAALYAFGPLSMLGWSWVTRRDLWLRAVAKVTGIGENRAGELLVARALGVLFSLPAGIAAAAVLMVAISLVDWVVGLALGMSDSPWFLQ